jgi:concanavalin A-like lectin/glucanase superfamily protein
MSMRLVRALLVFCMLAAVAAPANASVVSRLVDVETPTSQPYGLDQVSSNCSGSSVTRDTSRAYTGIASLRIKLSADATCGALYARGIFNENNSNHLVEGDDFWVGYAIYLPSGFWAAHDRYTDLIRIDSYVDDSGNSTTDAQRQSIDFAAFSSDAIYMRAAAVTGPVHDMVGPLSTSVLPEGRWNWVEMHVKLNDTDGSAVNQLKINGKLMGSSTRANVFSGRSAYNRVRYGFVSLGGNDDTLTAWMDRISISASERGPAGTDSPPSTSSYSQQVLGASGLVSYWRLDETGGTVAGDKLGANPGAYDGPWLGAHGLIPTDSDTAAGFNGVSDRVVVPADGSLSPTGALSIEAIAKGSDLRGSLVRRLGSYELRMQSDGAVLFRVWIGGVAQSLESPPGSVQTGATYHLVGTYDGSTLRIYRNGAQIASRAQTGAMTSAGNDLVLGYNDYANTYFPGTIDDVAFYSRALDAATVDLHATLAGL